MAPTTASTPTVSAKGQTIKTFAQNEEVPKSKDLSLSQKFLDSDLGVLNQNENDKSVSALASGDTKSEDFPFPADQVIVEKDQMTVKGADGNPVTLQKVTVSEKPELKIYEPHKKLFTVDFDGDV